MKGTKGGGKRHTPSKNRKKIVLQRFKSQKDTSCRATLFLEIFQRQNKTRMEDTVTDNLKEMRNPGKCQLLRFKKMEV